MSDKKPAPITYKDAGVDSAAGDSVAEGIEHLCQRTHSPRVLRTPGARGGLAGLFRLDFKEKLFARNYKDPVLIAGTNGVGSKVKIAAALNKYDTLGIDLVAMNVNDLVVQGGEPLFFLDYLALHQLDPAVATQIIKGIADGCLEAGCALLGGETAEMPSIYSRGEFDMAGFAVGVVERAKMLDPRDIETGDSIIGLASSGLHANGYALARRVVEKSGTPFDQFIPDLGSTLADELLRPTRVYAKTVRAILARYKVKKIVKAMAHVANGGLQGTLPRVLPPGFSARLKRDAWTPAPIFSWLQKTGPVDTDEMFRVFNMGIGYLMIVRPTFTKPIMTALRTLGEKPCFLGKIRKSTGEPRVEWS